MWAKLWVKDSYHQFMKFYYPLLLLSPRSGGVGNLLYLKRLSLSWRHADCALMTFLWEKERGVIESRDRCQPTGTRLWKLNLQISIYAISVYPSYFILLHDVVRFLPSGASIPEAMRRERIMINNTIWHCCIFLQSLRHQSLCRPIFSHGKS